MTPGTAAATVGIGDAFILSIIGLMIVFFVLVVLMAVIKVIRAAAESMTRPADRKSVV